MFPGCDEGVVDSVVGVVAVTQYRKCQSIGVGQVLVRELAEARSSLGLTVASIVHAGKHGRSRWPRCQHHAWVGNVVPVRSHTYMTNERGG